MNFAESVNYLYSLGNEVEAMKLGLDNIRSLLAALGEPHAKYLKVQVAGTNGKGSVCAFLDAICVSAAIKTGLYTSPHLVSITERIRIDGVDISEQEFARHATNVRDTAERSLTEGVLEYRPTFFEHVTTIALLAFASEEVELAILETGLGGRLDATTAANAEIAAITQIDYDHQEYLGETLAEIAAEKAAIIHAGSTVVISEQQDEVMAVILERCSDLGVETFFAGKIGGSEKGGNTTGRECVLDGKSDTPLLPLGFPAQTLGLLGHHQIENAKVALLLAETLQDQFPITADNIVEGLQNARHPGRLEYQGRYLFDGAHNVGGAKALAAYLDEFETRSITLIFGAMRNKNVREISEILFPLATRIVLTEPDNSRALTYEELLEQIPGDILLQSVFATDRVSKALKIAETVTPDDGIILITGSLYLVGEVKRSISSY